MERSSNIPLLKRICFAMLFLSIFLPMAQSCSTMDLFVQKDTGDPAVSIKRDAPKTSYAWDIWLSDYETAREMGYLVPLVFLWPLPFVLTRRPGKRYQQYLKCVVELFATFLGASLFTLSLVFEDKLLIGAYVYFLAAGCYFLLVLYELGLMIRRHTRGLPAG